MSENKSPLELIGEKVQLKRKELGMTQEQFADKYSYPRTTLAKLEAGKRDFKSTEILILAEQLGVSCDYLLGRTRTAAADNLTQAAVQRYGLREQELQSLERLTALARLHEKHQRITDGIDRLVHTYKEIRNDKTKEAQALEIGIEQNKLEDERNVLEAEMLEAVDPGEGYFKPPQWTAPIRCRRAWQQLHAIGALLTLEEGENALDEIGEYLFLGDMADGFIQHSNGTPERRLTKEEIAKLSLLGFEEAIAKTRHALNPQ
ncbi:MAG: helix-turn-helix domain-containing protein [Clostridiales bacterium]|jgi:transcriptional regulator with XRE-family HTH domain|nr:helix-turn-helix domain-containing protein [Clostridiales bacterium]